MWIKRPVVRGEGLNDWLYRRAFHLAKENVTAESAAKALHDLVGQDVRPGEITRQVKRAYAHARGASCNVTVGRAYICAPSWPMRDDALLARLWEDHPATVDELAALSPVQAPAHPLDVLRQLHRADDNALLCLGVEPTGPFLTLPLAKWEQRRDQIQRWEMCVPNLMRSERGQSMEGKPSARCRDNSCGMGAQRFIVLELDIPPHAAVVAQLGATAPDVCAAVLLGKFNLQRVRMIVHSAGKSLHAWLPADGMTQDQINRFYRTWCLYGGDWRGSLPEQQFRLPAGYRCDKHAVQRVIYWNPEGVQP